MILRQSNDPDAEARPVKRAEERNHDERLDCIRIVGECHQGASEGNAVRSVALHDGRGRL